LALNANQSIFVQRDKMRGNFLNKWLSI
jgi:hypothetical protein